MAVGSWRISLSMNRKVIYSGLFVAASLIVFAVVLLRSSSNKSVLDLRFEQDGKPTTICVKKAVNFKPVTFHCYKQK